MRRMKISSHYYCVVTSRCCCVAAPRSASLTHCCCCCCCADSTLVRLYTAASSQHSTLIEKHWTWPHSRLTTVLRTWQNTMLRLMPGLSLLSKMLPWVNLPDQWTTVKYPRLPSPRSVGRSSSTLWDRARWWLEETVQQEERWTSTWATPASSAELTWRSTTSRVSSSSSATARMESSWTVSSRGKQILPWNYQKRE